MCMYVCIYVRLYVRICNHHNRWKGGRIIKEERKKCNYLLLKKKKFAIRYLLRLYT